MCVRQHLYNILHSQIKKSVYINKRSSIRLSLFSDLCYFFFDNNVLNIESLSQEKNNTFFIQKISLSLCKNSLFRVCTITFRSMNNSTNFIIC